MQHPMFSALLQATADAVKTHRHSRTQCIPEALSLNPAPVVWSGTGDQTLLRSLSISQLGASG